MTRLLLCFAGTGLLAGALLATGSTAAQLGPGTPVAPEALAGEEWVLRAWNVGEPAPEEPEVTLVFEDGRFAGSSGCNRYSAAVTVGGKPGDVALGPAVGTRMACPEPVMSVEARFLAELPRVHELSLLGDQLALSHEQDGAPRSLIFARRGEEGEGDEAAIDPEAMAIAMRMAQRLSGAERLFFRVDASYDAIQDDGQAVEFGGIREVTLQRPDRLHVSVTDRSLGHRLLVYDGRTLSFWNEANAAYAQTPRTGSLDGVIDYLTDDLGVKLPLAELLSAELPRLFEEDVEEASSAGVETLDGVECDHLVFRNDNVGFQVWVARNGEPVPRRIVIVYEHAEGRPQFRADLSEWNLSPRTPASLFAFRPPAGAERVPFLPRRAADEEEAR
jgi:heat shock protein HslJ